MVNYYELLEIPQNADKATIEQAIRKQDEFGTIVRIIQM